MAPHPSRRAVVAFTALAALAAAPALRSQADAPALRLNQIQVVGSHNSYHVELPPNEFGPVSVVGGSVTQGLQYSHPPLDQQFAGQHVRQIELDLYADPKGGQYARPPIRLITGQKPDYDPAMNEPGTKVLHIAGLDYHSTCVSLTACLRAVKKWSDANPSHIPIAILLEFKDTLDIPVKGIPPVPLTTWTRARLLDAEQEILSVFARGDILAPDDVRSPGKSLEQSVLTDGWPLLDSVRGKVMFLMDGNQTQRAAYLEGNPSLEGRLVFTAGTPGQDDAAFVQRNDPNSGIAALVEKGYLVRTRADADTVQARTGDTTMRDAALAGGAQWVSTDYPVPGLAARFATGYYTALPGFVTARCNPVSAPQSCRSVRP
ncbi:phosphatidylinositol-specific phospholipase C1-like protein [Actinocorallia longicatena]|uniref:Phosphatidylinositol-specific phospholipase C1-like protein n=1 Tax=Actinocorallia longicatena TaxID=111803 RepID=A0ABP6PVM6_9ACTN